MTDNPPKPKKRIVPVRVDPQEASGSALGAVPPVPGAGQRTSAPEVDYTKGPFTLKGRRVRVELSSDNYIVNWNDVRRGLRTKGRPGDVFRGRGVAQRRPRQAAPSPLSRANVSPPSLTVYACPSQLLKKDGVDPKAQKAAKKAAAKAAKAAPAGPDGLPLLGLPRVRRFASL